MNTDRENNKLPVHKRIIFWFVIPVFFVGIVISGLLISYLSPPMESYLTGHLEANLRLASNLGLRICETHFNQLLDMRLEDNPEMNNALKNEALEQIKATGSQMPNVHMLVAEGGQFIKTISIDFQKDVWNVPDFANTKDTILDTMLGEDKIKAHIRFFPFWDWHIISFVNKKDYLAPISTANQIIYLSTLGVLVAVFITLILVFHNSVTNPLNRLITATIDVAKGKFTPIHTTQDNEIGQLTAFFNSMIDSLKKKTDEVDRLINQLKESEERYRSLVDLSPDAVFVHQEGKIKYINPFGANILGTQNPKDLIGKSVMEFIHPDFHEAENSRIKKIYDDHVTLSPQELKCVRIDKQEIAVETTRTLIEYSGQPAILNVARDITQRKQAEAALRESEEKFRALVEQSPTGISLIGKDGQYKYLNPQFIEMFGYTIEDVPTGTEWFEKAFPNENDRDVAAKTWVEDKKQIGVGKSRPRIYTVTCKDGSSRVIRFIPVMMENQNQFVIYEDISESKNLEDQLRQSQKFESIGTLTGGIAHDFNNILGIIVGNTELALDDVPEWNRAHSNLKEIKTASLRATKIIKQLLSFSRKTDQELQPIEITLVIKDALKFLRSTIPTTIDILQNIQATDETILADPTQINQIMMNLLINASQAMEQTGGNLTVNVEKVILDENSAKNYPDLSMGNYVKVMVSDTGPGIASEIIDRIFDPYFTTKELGKGSGMGLAVVHGIVKNHHGAITVDSKPGRGTTFSILFPITTEKPEIEKDTTDELLLGSETVLFVDDEKSIVEVVQMMLELLGYKVKTAMAPQEALDQFSADPRHFDLVITDMTMPKMTGVMLSEKIMEIRPDIPVIICTGHSALIDEERAQQLGIGAYVMKPIDMKEISKTIRKVLDESKSAAHD